MARLKVLLLDFDGVIIESNDVKYRAFERVFKPYPERLPEIMDYYCRTTGIRFVKFRHVYENILKQTYTDEIAAHCATVFADFSVRECIRCPYVKGAIEFLEYFLDRVPMYVISINPPEDLARVIAGRGLDRYFKKVYTPQKSKTEPILEILKAEGVAPGEAVFVGDTLWDHRFALESGVPFIGRQADDDFSKLNIPVFPDLDGVRAEIMTRM